MSKKIKHLAAGLDISMECPTATNKRGRSVIRGWREKQYVVMETPIFSFPFPMNTYIKANWVVRYVHEGEVIGFTTKGLDLVNSHDFFILKYPGKVEAHLLRKQMRMNVSMPVLIHTSLDKDESLHYKGMSLDISAGGLRIRMKEEVGKSDSYFLSFYLPTGESFKNVECEMIKSSHETSDVEIGMKFLNLEKKYKKAIDLCLCHFFGESSSNENLLPGEKKNNKLSG